MFIEDYMTANPQTIEASAPLQSAKNVMKEHSIRHLPVMDGGGRLMGILSDRDVRSAVGYDKALCAQLTASEVMTHDPTTIPVSATLDEALAVFHAQRFGALPVVESSNSDGPGKLVGIVTRSDILRAFFEVLGLDEAGVRIEVALPNGSDDLGVTFAALKKSDQRIISAVVSRMRRDGGEPSLYLRVAGANTHTIERCLRDAAVIVLESEHA